MSKDSDLRAQNQRLQEELKKTRKGLTDLKSSTLTQSESEKTIQDLEMQLMEKSNQLQRERDARRNLEQKSSSKQDTSESDKIIQDLEIKLMEKSKELKQEKENREKFEEEVKKLRVQVEEKKKDEEGDFGKLTREKTSFDLADMAQQVYDEKAEEKARNEAAALELAMNLMKEGRGKGEE